MSDASTIDPTLIVSAIATLIAGLGGAALGGLIAARVQEKAAERELRQRRKEAAVGLLNTLIIIRNSASDLERTMREMESDFAESMCRAARDPQQPLQGRPAYDVWEPYTPVLGRQRVDGIAKGELLPIIDAQQYKLLRCVSLVVAEHHALEEMIETFAQIRREMGKAAQVEPTANVPNVLGFSKKQWEEDFLPHRVALASLILQIKTSNARLKRGAAIASVALGRRMLRHFRDLRFPLVEYPDQPWTRQKKRRPWWFRRV